MIDIGKYTTKAGAYLFYNGYFLFMFGWGDNSKGNKLGVVRFGGHREKNETVVQCVTREIKEETSLDIEFYKNNCVYVEKSDVNDYDRIKGNQENSPILLRIGSDKKYSIMYLAYGKGELKPDMETQGILLLRKEDIVNICSHDITFGEYKELGGKYILAKPLPDNGILTPNIQLDFLNKLFLLEPELISNYTKTYFQQ